MSTNILTIAGSDSGGGAGIQGDLKSISATGAYGLSVITALTAQNTMGVDAVHPVAISFLKQQMQAVAGDIQIDAVKIARGRGSCDGSGYPTAVQVDLDLHVKLIINLD